MALSSALQVRHVPLAHGDAGQGAMRLTVSVSIGHVSSKPAGESGRAGYITAASRGGNRGEGASLVG